jgi:hypothetical protein
MSTTNTDTDPELRRRTIKRITITTVSMGIVWFVIEAWLRGGSGSITLNHHWPVEAALAGLGLGIAVRGRVSQAGERRAMGEMFWATLLVVSLLPAILLVVYALAFVLSAGFVALEWIAWVLGVVLCTAAQLCFWAVPVAAFVTGMKVDDDGKAGFIFAGVVIAIGGFISRFLVDSFMAPWNGSLVLWVLDLRTDIQPWNFLLEDVIDQLSALDHVELMSLLMAVALDLCIALGVALLARGLRLLFVRNPRWRPYLPMGAAPVPDSVPVFGPRVLVPALSYIGLVWALFLISRFF